MNPWMILAVSAGALHGRRKGARAVGSGFVSDGHRVGTAGNALLSWSRKRGAPPPNVSQTEVEFQLPRAQELGLKGRLVDLGYRIEPVDSSSCSVHPDDRMHYLYLGNQMAGRVIFRPGTQAARVTLYRSKWGRGNRGKEPHRKLVLKKVDNVSVTETEAIHQGFSTTEGIFYAAGLVDGQPFSARFSLSEHGPSGTQYISIERPYGNRRTAKQAELALQELANRFDNSFDRHVMQALGKIPKRSFRWD